MSTSRFISAVVLLSIVISISGCFGQSETNIAADLREAVRKLQAEVVEMRQDIDALKKEIADFRKQNTPTNTAGPAQPSAANIKDAMMGTWTSPHVSFKEVVFRADGTFQTARSDGDKLGGTYIVSLNDIQRPREPFLVLTFSHGHTSMCVMKAVSEKNMVLCFAGQNEAAISFVRK